MQVKGEEKKLAFHYHDLGYIMLAPCLPFVREMRVAHEKDSPIITSEGMFAPHMAGQFVFLDGVWRKIHRVEDADNAVLLESALTAGTTVTPVVTMNEIWLRGDGVSLDKLQVEYTPRVW